VICDCSTKADDRRTKTVGQFFRASFRPTVSSDFRDTLATQNVKNGRRQYR